MILLPLAIGAGLGLAKSALIDKPQADKQRKLAAATAAYSPWTGMTPQMPKDVDYLGPMLQGGMTGAMLGQSMATAGQQEQLAGLQQQYLKNQNMLMEKQLGGAAGSAFNTSMPMGGGMNMGFGAAPQIGAALPPGGVMAAAPMAAAPAVNPYVAMAQRTKMNAAYANPEMWR